MAAAIYPIIVLSAPTESQSTDCLGSETSTNAVVYLHGMDTSLPSEQETIIRKKLSAIAVKSNCKRL